MIGPEKLAPLTAAQAIELEREFPKEGGERADRRRTRRPMSPVLFIRKHVLGLSQAQLAAELDVTQPTVQRWETAGLFPAEQQIEVRRLGMAACKTWSDTWFFEVPEAPRAPASGGPRAQLLAAVAAYCTRTGMSRARLATIVVRDGKFFTRIDRGGDFTVTTFEKFMAYFAPGHGRSAEGRRR